MNCVGATKVYVLDLTAHLCTITKTPETFEDLGIKILNDIPSEYETIYIGCDTYRSASIKSPERKIRGESQKLLLRSAKVRIAPDFQKFLSNVDNKERLFELIEGTWDGRRNSLDNRVIYFSRGILAEE